MRHKSSKEENSIGITRALVSTFAKPVAVHKSESALGDP
jgi:hypothetical protein